MYPAQRGLNKLLSFLYQQQMAEVGSDSSQAGTGWEDSTGKVLFSRVTTLQWLLKAASPSRHGSGRKNVKNQDRCPLVELRGPDLWASL